MRKETVMEAFLFDNKKKKTPIELVEQALSLYGARAHVALIQHHEELGIPEWILFVHIRLVSLIKATATLKERQVYVPRTFYLTLKQHAFHDLRRQEIQKMKEAIHRVFPGVFDPILKEAAYV